MSIEELQKRHEYVINRVQRLRYWQIEVDVHHCNGAKDTKKRMEREIDKLLREELKIIKSKQKELF